MLIQNRETKPQENNAHQASLHKKCTAVKKCTEKQCSSGSVFIQTAAIPYGDSEH